MTRAKHLIYATFSQFVSASGTADDNCGLVEPSFTLVSEVSDGNTCPEIVTRTYSIEDSCGNVGSCQQIIVVNDTVPPTLLCPVISVTDECSIDSFPAYATLDEFLTALGSADDNCELDSASFTLLREETDSMMCPETFTRTYQIADICGNVATCQQTIIIDDIIPPVLLCPPSDDTLECDISMMPPFATLADFIADGGSATDNCELVDTSFTLLSGNGNWIMSDTCISETT